MMNTRLAFGLAAALLLGTAADISAQDITLGLKGGVVVTDLSIDDPVDPTNLDTRTSFAVGPFLEVGLGEVFSVQPEILLVRKGAGDTVDGVDTSFELTYIEIPVLLKAGLSAPGVGVRPSVYAGPVFSFESSCKVKGSDGSASVSLDCADAAFDLEIETKSLDFGAALGAGIEIPVGSAVIVGDVRYTVGFTNINDTPGATQIEIKNRAWAFLAGMGWPLGN